MESTFSIAIHGGAGTIQQKDMTFEKQQKLESTLKLSIETGIEILKNGGSALDATAAAVVVMENSDLFNAGKGSVFNAKEFIEMDAAIMCGQTQNAGAVTCVRNIKNPILLSKEILLKSSHVLLDGLGAESFARENNIQFESNDYFYTQHRYDQLKQAKKAKRVQLDHSDSNDGKFGTVGAVAVDLQGNLAASTSTGGMTNQVAGRVGDTPMIGSGTFAKNQTCAVSCTGTGESFIRAVAAYDVSALMAYGGHSLSEAGNRVVFENLPKVDGMGGLIGVDRSGNIILPFNSEGMYRAFCTSGEPLQIRMYKD
jgi:L-asparaginase / beta-aspartyl-peptidase